MRFEFDHKSGTMRPGKDDSIYFAQSQGGGLIVDDKKNNVRYIVERDGRITKLFGSFRGDGLNFYDMRDARMISDRVVRLLGREHKYADFHYFMRGYHMSESVVQKCSDFLDESVWVDIHKQSNCDTVRKEEGEIIGKLPDGKNLILPAIAFSKGELYEIENERKFTNFNMIDVDFDDLSDYNNVIYAAVIAGDIEDTYYLYDENADGPVNMTEWFRAPHELRDDNFEELIALIKNYSWNANDLEELKVKAEGRYFEFKNKYVEKFYVFWNYDYAVEEARDRIKNFIESHPTGKETVETWRNTFGDSIFDENSMKRELEESQRSYYSDLREDEAIDELLSYKVIEETEEYFEVDEDGDIDKSSLKYGYLSYVDEYIEKYIDSIDDIVSEFFHKFGYDGAEYYVDLDKLTKLSVEHTGPGDELAGYDGEEHSENVNGTTYYIYRED